MDIAIEELKILQDIIKSQEEFRVKIKGWCIAILTAILVAFITEKVSFSTKEYLIVSMSILILFLWLDVLYRVAQNRAIDRSAVVEGDLRGGSTYVGPFINCSLSRSNSIVEQLRALTNIRLYLPYIVLLSLVINVALFLVPTSNKENQEMLQNRSCCHSQLYSQ